MSNHIQEFTKAITEANHGKWMMLDVFADFCRMAALSLESPFSTGSLTEEIESEYKALAGKYEDQQPFAKAFAILVDALEEKHEEFLGRVHENIGAANVRNGQFFTPASVANMMAEITAPGTVDGYTPGKVITINDPSCGASVNLIAAAEVLIGRGVRQSDILIEGGDIDLRACDMSFVELSLLGYAAVIKHEDALAMKPYSRTRFTPGYFLHCFPMRGWRHGMRVCA